MLWQWFPAPNAEGLCTERERCDANWANLDVCLACLGYIRRLQLPILWSLNT